MTTKQQILQVLNYSEKTRDTLAWELYLSWCDQQAYSVNHFQLLITNNSLYNWFICEYEKREKQFLFTAKPYIGNVPVTTLVRLYDDCTTSIAIYPKAILKEVIKEVRTNAVKPIHNQASKIALTLN